MSEVENKIHGNTKHGHARAGNKTKTYKTWESMMSRCKNKNNNRYYTYGARGINVCERWNRFENFLADMGEVPEGLTLDRIDNDKGYYKENCKWSTYQEQSLNKKTFGKSKYRGVSWHKRRKKWHVRVILNKKSHYVGYARNEIAAAKMFNEFVLKNKFPNKLNIIGG